MKTRFDMTEKNALDKARKLAGKKNQVANSVMNKLLMASGPNGDFFMNIMDRLGIYGDRIEFLFSSCHNDIHELIEVILKLFKNNRISQDYILGMKNQVDFDNLVKKIY